MFVFVLSKIEVGELLICVSWEELDECKVGKTKAIHYGNEKKSPFSLWEGRKGVLFHWRKFSTKDKWKVVERSPAWCKRYS